MTSLLSRLVPFIALLPTIALATGTAAASWDFSSVSDALPPPSDPVVSSDIKPVYDQQVLSVGTALGENGAMYGFRVTDAGTPHAFAIRLDTNPKGYMLDKEDMLGLTGAEDYCYWIICLGADLPFGIRITETGTAITGFSNTVDDAPVIASTQVAPDGSQTGVVILGATVSTLDDVPWLIAINDAEDPLVLGYDGSDGDCLVYGDNCAPPACEEDDEHGPGHHNRRGRGHEEHGNGHGYGHDHDDCEDTNALADPLPITGGPLLLIAHDDGSITRLRFPTTTGTAAVVGAFPVAINSATAILRGNLEDGISIREKLLLRCDFATPDANDDGIVDCTGDTLAVIGEGIRAGTVLGFSLTDAGLLVGNYGYNAAGVGAPFLVDLDDEVPQAVPLHNLASGDEDWEINTVTDLNTAGEMIGYGYRDCGTLPQATRLTPSLDGADELVMAHDATVHDGYLRSGEMLDLTPQVTGGSGNYEYRVAQRTAADSDWQLLQDWSAVVAGWTPGDLRGDVCFKVDARDATTPEQMQSRITRFVVVDEVDGTPGESHPAAALAATQNADLRDLLGLASGNPLLIALLMLLAHRRRTPDQ